MNSSSCEAPLVSVLTTCYNRERFIGQTIESVLASTFADFEYIIVDDCSGDRSFEIVSAYAGKDARVRAYRNETNLGDYPNRNRAASYARGRYLKYVDSDDAHFPHTLEVMVRALSQFPDAGFALLARPLGDRPYPLCLQPADAIRFHFRQQDLFSRAPGNAMIVRSCFESIGRFSGLAQIGDFELWLRMAKRFPLVVLPRDLQWCRVHDHQVQHENSSREKHQMKMTVLEQELFTADCPVPASEVKEFLAQFVKHRRRGQLVSGLGKMLRLVRRLT